MALLWASTLLQDLLPRKILDRLQNAQVDPHLPAQPEETMYITDGASGNVIKAVLSPGARRVGKEALRKLLAEDLPVRVSLDEPRSFYVLLDALRLGFLELTFPLGCQSLGIS